MDEITTVLRSRQPFFTLCLDSLAHHHLPTYFVFLSWLAPFGSGEAALRIPSAVCGALSCALVTSIGRRLGNLQAGYTAGLLMAFSPFQVSFGQEARPSALVVCMITIALRGLVDLSLDPKGASRPLSDSSSSCGPWATYLFGTLGAVSVMGVALFWVLAAVLAMVLLARHQDVNRAQFFRNCAIVHAIIAALMLPVFGAMLLLVLANGRLLEGLDWILPVTQERLLSGISAVYLFQIFSPVSSRLFPSIAPLLKIIIVSFALLGYLYFRRDQVVLKVMLLTVAVLPLSLLAISAAVPLWLPRYLLWSAPAFFIFTGVGVAVLPRAQQTSIVAAVGIIAWWNLEPYYQSELKPRWDLAAAVVEASVRNRDLIFVDDVWVPRMLNVYLSRGGRSLRDTEWSSNIDTAISWLSSGARVWAIFGRVGQVDKEDLVGFRRRLAPLGSPAAEMREGLDITIMRFDPLRLK
jgi:uncharacterized membrane protein